MDPNSDADATADANRNSKRGRRELVALLGLGSAGSLAGCLGWVEGLIADDETQGTPTEPSDPSTTTEVTSTLTPVSEPVDDGLQHVYEQVRELEASEPPPEPAFDFNYETKSFEDVEDPNFGSLEATGRPDRNGDRIRIEPDALSADELAARLRAVWGVGTETEVTRTVGGVDVTFAGGVSGTYVFLVGARTIETEDDPDEVLAARSTSLRQAEGLTLEFEAKG